MLFDIKRAGQTIPAIAIGSKTGNIFILNRETGVPIFGVEERAVPKSDVPGEVASSTQPFPLKPLPITPQKMTADDAWGVDDSRSQMVPRRNQQAARRRYIHSAIAQRDIGDTWKYRRHELGWICL